MITVYLQEPNDLDKNNRYAKGKHKVQILDEIKVFIQRVEVYCLSLQKDETWITLSFIYIQTSDFTHRYPFR